MMRVIHTSRSPFEILLLAAVVVAGVTGIASPGDSGRVVAALPHWSQLVWYTGLAAAGLLALVGALTNRLWSLYVECGALITLGVLLVAYTAGIIAVEGVTVAVSALLTLGFGAACFARVHQIGQDIRHILEGGAR